MDGRRCLTLMCVRFLRRNTTESPAPTEADAVEVGPAGEPAGEHRAHLGKGRPTPKRRDAESRRRGPIPPPPRTQREAFRRGRGNKEERRASSTERRERMLAGDEKYLLPRDRGPVKAYVRDLVDARRNLLGLFMPLAVLVLASLFTPSPVVQRYASLLTMVMLLGMFAEGLVLARLVTTKVRRKFPDATEKAYSLGWYAFTRASQLRRLRVPRPRVGYGQVN
jgi:hypothetical protein